MLANPVPPENIHPVRPTALPKTPRSEPVQDAYGAPRTRNALLFDVTAARAWAKWAYRIAAPGGPE